jgi:hypothetical protein
VAGIALFGQSLAAQNPSAAAAYAELRLSAGFMPDPRTVSLTAGGPIAPSVPGCSYGRVANAPDVKVHYQSSGSNTLYIYAQSGTDVTLLINMPDGSWRCDDDSFGGTNPIVIVPNAPGGRYDIWVGTFGEATAPATLYISELNPRGGGGDADAPAELAARGLIGAKVVAAMR